MKFFVDTADTAEIKSLTCGGVTGNPSLVAKIGKQFADDVREMRAFGLTPVPLMDYRRMMREAWVPREPPAGKARATFLGWRPKTSQTIA